jgi:hypothetical protein
MLFVMHIPSHWKPPRLFVSLHLRCQSGDSQLFLAIHVSICSEDSILGGGVGVEWGGGGWGFRNFEIWKNPAKPDQVLWETATV